MRGNHHLPESTQCSMIDAEGSPIVSAFLVAWIENALRNACAQAGSAGKHIAWDIRLHLT